MPYLGNEPRTYFRHWTSGSTLADVVLLHGFGEHGGHYHRLAHVLNSANLDVWGMDLPGHGLSDGERGRFGSVAAVADAAQLLLSRVRHRQPEPRPVFAVGHSLGGVAVAELVVRGCSLDGVVMTGAPLSGLPADAPAFPVMSLDAFYLDALAHDPLGFDTALAEPALWKQLDVASERLGDTLAFATTPTLFVNGEHDAYAPPAVAKAWAQRFDSPSVHVVAGGHHDIVNDVAHAEVAAAITGFIGRLMPTTGHTTAPSPVLDTPVTSSPA